MKKSIILLTLGAILLLAGCVSTHGPGGLPGLYEPDNSQARQYVQLGHMTELVLLEDAAALIPTGNTRDLAAIAAARGANDFAFRLGAALIADAGYENFVFSPFSVWMPLAALVNATSQPLRPALTEAIGVSGMSAEDINRAASRMLFDLTNERARRDNWGQWGGCEESPLHIANAVFVDYNWPLRHEFAQVFADYFRGSAMNVDFNSQAAVDAVNNWASDNTNGLIDHVIEEFDPDAVAAIANAIYFSGGWSEAFNPGDTHRGTFFSPDGEREVYFMQQHGFFIYHENEAMQAIDLRFAGGINGMKIILPRYGDAVEFLSSMTNECFDNIQGNSMLGEGTIKLPRFAIENTVDNLADALKAMGVPLFDQQQAPLTGGLIYDGGLPVWLGSAAQAAMIEVDEEGATAAAVTVMDVRAESMPWAETTFEMICNTPFVFILHGNTTDGGKQVLFMGVVNQP